MGIFSESASLTSNGFDDEAMNLSAEPDLTTEELDAIANKLYEIMLSEAIAALDPETQEAVTESEAFEAFCEAKRFKKKTIVKLNQKDDLQRRTSQAAIIIAGERNDPLFKKLELNRQKEKELLGQIKRKYNSQATKAAKVAQRDFVKDVNKSKVMTTKDLSDTRRTAE